MNWKQAPASGSGPHAWISERVVQPGQHARKIALSPFYLAHPRLNRGLEEGRMILDVSRAETWSECMSILRHEAGTNVVQHALSSCTGRPPLAAVVRSVPRNIIRDITGPNPAEQALRSSIWRLWYAQSHPDEDFRRKRSPVWLRPRVELAETRYAGWPGR